MGLNYSDALDGHVLTLRLSGLSDGMVEDMERAAAELRRLQAEVQDLQRRLDGANAAVMQTPGMVMCKSAINAMRKERDAALAEVQALQAAIVEALPMTMTEGQRILSAAIDFARSTNV